MELALMVAIIMGYIFILGMIMVTGIIALLIIDLIFDTYFGRRIIRKFVKFLKEDNYEEI